MLSPRLQLRLLALLAWIGAAFLPTLHAAGPNRSGRTRKTLVFGYSHRWMRPDDYLVQPDALLARLDPVARALVDATGLNHAANGAFRPCGEASAFERLAEAHGCTAAACQ